MAQQPLVVCAHTLRGIAGLVPQSEKAARLPTEAHRIRNFFLMKPPPIVPGVDAGADRTPSFAFIFFSLTPDDFVLKILPLRKEIG